MQIDQPELRPKVGTSGSDKFHRQRPFNLHIHLNNHVFSQIILPIQ